MLSTIFTLLTIPFGIYYNFMLVNCGYELLYYITYQSYVTYTQIDNVDYTIVKRVVLFAFIHKKKTITEGESFEMMIHERHLTRVEKGTSSLTKILLLSSIFVQAGSI